MGFDKHFYEDHCYMDDPMNNYVGMNVEIIGDTSQASVSVPECHRNSVEKSARHSGSSLIHYDLNYETTNKIYETLDRDQYIHADCGTEHSGMFLLEDEKLVKPGNKFKSLEVFVQYLNENAKRWNYYYSCSDSRKPNTDIESYVYNCVYLRNKEKYKKKGLRNRINTFKSDCPCKIKLRRLPYEKELTIVYVCNHHDHELSSEQFRKLQHGRRLPPYVKEEIFDFLTLHIDKNKIRKYVEMETGFRMSRPFFYALEKNLEKKGNIKRQITEERLKMLNEKIVAAEELYRLNNEEQRLQTTEQHSQALDEVTSTSSTKKNSTDPHYSETLKIVKDSHKFVKCEIQKKPWVPEQCVPVLPINSRNESELNETKQELNSEKQQDSESFNLSIEYYDPDVITQVTTADVFTEDNDYDNTDIESQNDVENIAYETVVVEAVNEEINEVQEYVSVDSEIIDSDNVINSSDIPENYVEYEEVNNEHTIEYTTEDTEHLVDGYQIINDNTTGHDVGVQTNRNIDTGQTLQPVFDVYMKDGNVMGFVVNNNAINGLKDGVDEAIQTSEDIIYSDMQEVENEDSEIVEDSNDQTTDTYTKHEYVHRYNIEQYMTQQHFPKYVEILAKETHMDVLNMFTNIYHEKAMFKLTTTQKGNEGNTRIRYITHNGKIKKKKTDDTKRERFGKNLQSIFILKEKMRMLKKKNDELVKRNEYLQDVARKLVNLD